MFYYVCRTLLVMFCFEKQCFSQLLKAHVILGQKKKKGLSHEPARISMWRRFSALVYAATVFLKVFFFFYVIDSQ